MYKKDIKFNLIVTIFCLAYIIGVKSECNKVACVAALAGCISCTWDCEQGWSMQCGCCLIANCIPVWEACKGCIPGCGSEELIAYIRHKDNMRQFNLKALGSGLGYQVDFNFCSLKDLQSFLDLGVNVVLQKGLSSSNKIIPAAWVTVGAPNILTKNSLTWAEFYGLTASFQTQITDGTVIDSSTSYADPTLGVLYTLNGGFIPTSSDCRTPGNFCAKNLQGRNTYIGLEQMTVVGANEQSSLLGVFLLGNNGQVDMLPYLQLNITIGNYQQNAAMLASITYPVTSFTLSPTTSKIALNYNVNLNQFLNTPCRSQDVKTLTSSIKQKVVEYTEGVNH